MNGGVEGIETNKPWSCESCRRIRGDGDVGLGGIVVMTGATDITAEAGMCVLSWSMLGLDGSSGDRNRGPYLQQDKKTLNIIINTVKLWNLPHFVPIFSPG